MWRGETLGTGLLGVHFIVKGRAVGTRGAGANTGKTKSLFYQTFTQEVEALLSQTAVTFFLESKTSAEVTNKTSGR